MANNPGFALDVALTSPRWLATGWAYEITSLDVHAAHDHATQAAEALGWAQGTRARIRGIVTGDHSPGMFVRQVPGRAHSSL